MTATISHRQEIKDEKFRGSYVPVPDKPVNDRRSGIPDPMQLQRMIIDAKGGRKPEKITPAPRPADRPKTLKRKIRDLMQDGRWRCTDDVLLKLDMDYSAQTVRPAMTDMAKDGLLVMERCGPNSTMCFRWAGKARAAK